MKRAALLVLLFAGSAAAGTVYKYVGPDGVTIYSDRAPSLFRRLGGFDVGIEPVVRS
jgi:hypothetical protein